jgi:hypothetical protein
MARQADHRLAVPGDAAQEALGVVAAVRDDPDGRLRLASRFYDDRPGQASIRATLRASRASPQGQVRPVLADLSINGEVLIHVDRHL